MDCDLNEKVAGRTSIARTFHSRQVIFDALEASGVRLRAVGQGHGNPSQLKFGYLKVGGQIIQHMDEQQVIKAVKDLKADGMTLRQIAHRMTILRIPSKSGKPRWHPMMVKRVLDG